MSKSDAANSIFNFESLTNAAFAEQGVYEDRIWLITSGLRREGKTTTTLGMGIALAKKGLNIALIDWDNQNKGIGDVFGVKNSPGLMKSMLGHAELTETEVRFLSKSKHDGTMNILRGGRIDSYSSGELQKVIEKIRVRYDSVLIDSSNLNESLDALRLARKADGVILVVGAGTTKKALAVQSKRRIIKAGGKIIGVVLNKFKGRMPGFP